MTDALRRCGAPKGRGGGKCQRVLDAFGVCVTHGQRLAPADDAQQLSDASSDLRSEVGSGVRQQRAQTLQAVAAMALAEGVTQKEAAARVGIHEETLGRWVRERPELRAEADQLRQVMQSRYIDAVWADLDRVRAMVIADALNPDTKPADRQRILKTLVDTANGTESATEVKRKLNAIHRFIQGDNGDGLAPSDTEGQG